MMSGSSCSDLLYFSVVVISAMMNSPFSHASNMSNARLTRFSFAFKFGLARFGGS